MTGFDSLASLVLAASIMYWTSNAALFANATPTTSPKPSIAPSISVVPTTSSPPTGTRSEQQKIAGITMVLEGVNPLNNDDRSWFEQKTKIFIENFYNDDDDNDDDTRRILRNLSLQKVEEKNLVQPVEESLRTRTNANGYRNKNGRQLQDPIQKGLYAVIASIKVTQFDPPYLMRRNLDSSNLRNLADSLTITYDQTSSFRLDGSNIDPPTIDIIIKAPFDNVLKRQDYVEFLKEENRAAFRSLVRSSLPILPSTADPKSDNNNMNTIIIITSVVGGVALLVLIGFIFWRRKVSKPDSFTGRRNNVIEGNGISLDENNTILTDNQEETGIMGPRSIATNPHSIATYDPDYDQRHHNLRDSGGATVSTAGGTIGTESKTNMSIGQTTLLTPDIFGTQGSVYTDDASFEQHVKGQGTTMREDVFEIVAPPGKLGIVIDTPGNGAPEVHSLKESCPIADQLMIGDKVLAVDGEDVRSMTAIKVSKLISQKSGNATRTFTIIRTSIC